MLSIKTHDFWFIFGDNDEVISRMLNLMQATRSKALTIMMKYPFYYKYIKNYNYRKRNSFFGIFSLSQKIQMEMVMKEKHFKTGDVLYLQGASPEFGYMVSKGHLEIFDCPEATFRNWQLRL